MEHRTKDYTMLILFILMIVFLTAAFFTNQQFKNNQILPNRNKDACIIDDDTGKYDGRIAGKECNYAFTNNQCIKGTFTNSKLCRPNTTKLPMILGILGLLCLLSLPVIRYIL
jgi:hypothetical protein